MTELSAEDLLTRAHDDLARIRHEIGRIVFGQDEVVTHLMTGILSGGHVLLVGAPGLAKTLLVNTVARVLGLNYARIQCTPDLMPSDIIGSEVMDSGDDGKRSFRFVEGPVFTQLLMADEINRASPRTQSALLQAMQERTITVNGQIRELPHPFHVMATQNPIEQEGTYPLPEAQLDRFMMQINIGFPDLDAERRMLIETTSAPPSRAAAIIDAARLSALQTLVRDIPVGEQIVTAVLTLIKTLRPDDANASADAKKYIGWAPGPRAAQSLLLAAKSRALIEKRGAPSLDDVAALALPVLRHRMALNYAARADGVTIQSLIAGLTGTL